MVVRGFLNGLSSLRGEGGKPERTYPHISAASSRYQFALCGSVQCSIPLLMVEMHTSLYYNTPSV